MANLKINNHPLCIGTLTRSPHIFLDLMRSLALVYNNIAELSCTYQGERKKGKKKGSKQPGIPMPEIQDS